MTSRIEAGVVGMGMSNSVRNESIQKETAVQLSGLAGSATSLFAGVATGLEDEDIAKNMFAGQNIGSNAARDNALFVGGKVKIPFPGPDYDLHSGIQGSLLFRQDSFGTDGKGVSFLVVPEIGVGMYVYGVPHNQTPQITTSIGYKDTLSADYIRTYQGESGYGYTIGVSTSPKLVIPINISTDIPNKTKK